MILAQTEDGRAVTVLTGLSMVTLRIISADSRGEHPREWDTEDELAFEPDEARDLIRAIETALDRSGLS